MLTLTAQVTNQTSSAFTPATKAITNAAGFTASFVYQETLPPLPAFPADGVTFCIQNNAATTIGAGLGNLGYQGMANSAAVQFNIYNNTAGTVHIPGASYTGFGADGALQ